MKQAEPAQHVEAASGLASTPHWRSAVSIAIWAATSVIAMFFALIGKEGTAVDGTYIPRGNDSFYHARRILDAAIGSRGFYQFDERLNAPDGSWISWPWGYDYLMAKATQVALWLVPALDPMAFISHVPTFWILVNAGLFMAAAGAIGLPREMQFLAMVCYALSPLTQMLHSLAMIDHHYVEHTFVLLNAWLGIRWFSEPNRAPRAIALGVALGAAPAVHNGLFILQLVPLIGVFILWLRNQQPTRSALTAFAIALVVTTQLVLLPSEPYRKGLFDFGLLSWFHFYVALCTAGTMLFMAYRHFTRLQLTFLVALASALAAPLTKQIIAGLGFLSGNFSMLDQIAEVRSPYRLAADTLGPVATAGYYSWLLLLAPPLIGYYGVQLFRERRPHRIYYAAVVVFGLALLLDQWRLEYFGVFGLLTGALLVLEDLRARRHWPRAPTFAAALAVIALAYQPPLHQRLFALDVPGGDFGYARIAAALSELQARCAEDPGVVLASSSDGTAILFHTECSVVATNFILTTDDARHIDEANRLLGSTPAIIRTERPDIKYVLLRALDYAVMTGGEVRLQASPMVESLLQNDPPPDGYVLLKNLVMAWPGQPSEVYARLYKVTHPGDRAR